MLLGSFQLLQDDPTAFLRLTVLVVISLVGAITIHEFSHALVASGLGDNTARHLGRLSLNPRRHLDPMGTLMLLLAGFGWGKPVPVNEHRLAHGPKGTALVAAAGPLSNLMLAFLLAIPIKLGLLTWGPLSPDRIAYVMTGGFRASLADIVGMSILFNLLLAVFNLIPLAPLDGSKVMGGLIPRERAAAYATLERNGPVILVGIIMLDYMFGFGILWGIISPVVELLTTVATGY